MILTYEACPINLPDDRLDDEFEVFTEAGIEELLNSMCQGRLVSIWLGTEEETPCLHLSISGEFACLDYFELDHSSYSFDKSKCSEPTVQFLIASDLVEVSNYRIVTVDRATEAAKEFLATSTKPTCLTWKDGEPIL